MAVNNGDRVMLRICSSLLGAALGLWVLVSPVAAVTLTFDGNICNEVGNVCFNASSILQSYGDIAGQIDVSHRVVSGPGNGTQVQNSLLHWGPNYSDLADVAYGAPNAVSEIFLNPAPGWEVALRGFDLGAWPNTTLGLSRSSQATVFTADYSSSPFSTGPINVLGIVHTDIDPNLPFSPTGYRIQWGPDGYNVGIDNVAFDLRPTNAVPEPTALMLLGSGMIGLTAYRKWRRRG